MPIFVERGGHVAAFGGGDVNGFSMAHEIIDLVGEAEYFVVVGAHAVGHDRFVDADHVAVTYLEFLREEGQEWDTEGDFSRFGGSDVVSDRRSGL